MLAIQETRNLKYCKKSLLNETKGVLVCDFFGKRSFFIKKINFYTFEYFLKNYQNFKKKFNFQFF